MLKEVKLTFCDGPRDGCVTDYRDVDGERRCACGETVPHIRIRGSDTLYGTYITTVVNIEPALATSLARRLERAAESLRTALEETGDPSQATLPGVE